MLQILQCVKIILLAYISSLYFLNIFEVLRRKFYHVLIRQPCN